MREHSLWQSNRDAVPWIDIYKPVDKTDFHLGIVGGVFSSVGRLVWRQVFQRITPAPRFEGSTALHRRPLHTGWLAGRICYQRIEARSRWRSAQASANQYDRLRRRWFSLKAVLRCLAWRLAVVSIVTSMCVFEIKRNMDGSIDRYKVRLVVQGLTQQSGDNCDVTFAPVTKFQSNRTIFTL